MSGFAALVAAVEAVVPLLSGSTAITTMVVPLWVQVLPLLLAPLFCAAVPQGGTVVSLATAVVPPTPAVVPLSAGLLWGVTVGLFPPLYKGVFFPKVDPSLPPKAPLLLQAPFSPDLSP